MSKRKEDSIINQIAACIAKNPGRTGAELSQRLGKPGAYRRLSEVKRLGLARKGDRRLCTVSWKTADTWYAADNPPEPDRGETPQQAIRRLEGRIQHLVNENEKLTAMFKALDALGCIHFDYEDLEDDEMTLQHITGNVNDRQYTPIAKGACLSDAARKLLK